MQFNFKQFPEILPDNEEIFISKLIGVIESIDELSCLQVTRNIDSYHFRIAPSIPCYNLPLLKEVLKFHNMYGIHLDISKSIKSSGTLAFEIKI